MGSQRSRIKLEAQTALNVRSLCARLASRKPPPTYARRPHRRTPPAPTLFPQAIPKAGNHPTTVLRSTARYRLPRHQCVLDRQFSPSTPVRTGVSGACKTLESAQADDSAESRLITECEIRKPPEQADTLITTEAPAFHDLSFRSTYC